MHGKKGAFQTYLTNLLLHAKFDTCREDFLMALKDHQVLVLVGETGSGEKFQVTLFDPSESFNESNNLFSLI